MHILQDAKSGACYRYSLHIFDPLVSLLSTGRAFAIGTVHTQALNWYVSMLQSLDRSTTYADRSSIFFQCEQAALIICSSFRNVSILESQNLACKLHERARGQLVNS